MTIKFNSLKQGIRNDNNINQERIFKKDFILLEILVTILIYLGKNTIKKALYKYKIIIYYILFNVFFITLFYSIKEKIKNIIIDSDYIIFINIYNSCVLYFMNNVFQIFGWSIFIEFVRMCFYREERFTIKQIMYDILFIVILSNLSRIIGNFYFFIFVMIYSQICLYLLKREKALK